jgi:hypothetical protein
MAAKAKAKTGGERTKAPAAGGAAEGASASVAPPPAPSEAGAGAPEGGDGGDDEGILGPLWARLAVGAAAGVVIVSLGWFAIAPYIVAKPDGGVRLERVPPLTGMFILCGLPFLLAAAASATADLARGGLRVGLAGMTGAAAAGSGFLTAALITGISYFLSPLGLLGHVLLRALLAPAARGVRRADHVLQWAFVGVFWPTAIGVGAGFLLRNGIPRVLALSLAGALLGAVTTWICASLDPDAPPAEEPLDGADGAAGKEGGGAGAGG